MCGIAGVLNVHDAVESDLLMEEILHHQRFRGPDCTARKSFHLGSGQLLLGHNRLSIIDLSEAANQPFTDETGQYSVVFNGEIYNYLELRKKLIDVGERFATESDTEVLLKALKVWGMSAMEQFNGMFAFAFLNRREQKLFLVRDRFGVKPLYYTATPQSFLFASTCTVLGKFVGKGPDLRYIARGLSKWFFESDDEISPFVGVNALPPAHYAEVSIVNNEITSRIQKYYDLTEKVREKKEAISGKTHNQLIEQLRTIFRESIRLRLRSDVPVGVSLSGGIDSSTVAAFASAEVSGLTGINYGDPANPLTEGPLVVKLAREFNMNPEFVWSSEEELRTAFWETLDAQESPIYGLSYIAEYMIYKRAHERGIKVMLGGQGGDESFMGYRKYLFYYLQSLLKKHKFAKALQVSGWIAGNAWHQKSHLKDYSLAIKRYLRDDGIQSNLVLPETNFSLNLGNSELWQRQITDLMITSLPTQLKSEDRNSMRNSVETRLPFLDYNVVELGMALPPELKINKGYSKWAVRAIAAPRVPKEVRLARFKRSFDIRQEVVSEKMMDEIRQRLNDNYEKIAFVMPDRKKLELYSEKTVNSNQLRFQELMVLLWLTKTF
ncbi:MAG TPA: asparagine synthase (glutamine-hydrolyzing) [Ohtaekwangia sp.]|nr:asparagine synthase (glutamine-hydrolyzing) [Ohtaekwangia sp.]